MGFVAIISVLLVGLVLGGIGSGEYAAQSALAR